MKKIKYALSLALLAAAPAIFAQNIDTKAPAEPGFMVTLNVTNNGGGKDSVYIRNYNDTKDTLLFDGTKKYTILRGTKPTIYLKADSQYKLKDFKVGDSSETLTANFKTGRYGTEAVNGYVYTPSSGINEETNIVITWEEKPGWELKYENTSATEGSAVALKATEGSDDKTSTLVQGYYKTMDHTGDKVTQSSDMAAGTYYVWLKADETADKKGLDIIVPYQVNKKLNLTVDESKIPTITTEYQEGQPLSVVPIEGGTDAYTYNGNVQKGTWAWENPNQLLVKGVADDDSHKYTAIFTPDSSALYNTATAKIKVAAKYVATVTVEQTTGGVVSIENTSPDNKYIGTTSAYKAMKLVATPAVGYKIEKWIVPSAEITDSEVEVSNNYTPSSSDAIVVSAQFAKATRKIAKGSISNGTIEVWNGDEKLNLESEVDIEYGTALTIVAKPNAGYEVSKAGYSYGQTNANADGSPAVETTNFVVGGETNGKYTVSATFKQKPAEQKMVTVTTPLNGSVTMLTGVDGKTVVNPNSSVSAGTVVTVVALPNKGYKLSQLFAGETDITKDGAVTINQETNIRATFVKEWYDVTITAPEEVEITGITTTNGKAEYETVFQNVSAKVKDPDHYKLVSLLVNNRSVTNGSSVTVDGITTISAQVQELTPINILNGKTTEVVYNGKTPTYAVKTAAGLGNFTVKFFQEGSEVIPLGVGEYEVHISREYDNLYATYNNTSDYKLIIKAGTPGVKKIAYLSDGGDGATTGGEATVAGEWTTDASKINGRPAAELRATGGATTIYFIPEDVNLGYVAAKTVTVEEAKKAKTVTITNNSSNGAVSLMNGTIPVTDGLAFEGLTFTVAAKADKGYEVDWSRITVNGTALSTTNQNVTADKDLAIVVAADAFVTKKAASTPLSNLALTAVYSTKSLAQNISGLDSRATWSILYGKQAANNSVTIEYKTDSPIEVGTYTIYASCEEGDGFAAVKDKEIGTLIIGKAILTNDNVVAPIAEPLAIGADLSSSLLSGGEVKYNGVVVPGTFTWTSTKAINEAGDQPVTFIPQDKVNYDVTSLSIKSYVSLMGVRSVIMSTEAKNIVITDAQSKVVVSGNKVPVGMKLYITADNGKTIQGVSVNVAGAQYGQESVSGGATKWYCIAPAGDFVITVTFKSDDGGGTDTPSEGVAVTGITLNKSTLTLAPQKSEKLVATVAPTGATKKDVKWTSTDPAIASVDADGTVKALKTGKATIIATTVDGGFTAMCEVTVDAATGIEKILSESRVYGQRGQIIIEPAAPVEATIVNLAGAVIYKSLVNGTEQVPAYSGIYIVRLSASGKATTTKVIVR